MAIAALGAGIGAKAATAQDATPAQGQSVTSAMKGEGNFCLIPFDATVQQGPNKGLSLQGFLGLVSAEDGGITGKFAPLDRTDGYDAVGQSNGHGINLLIKIDDATAIYGVGTLENPLCV